MVLTSVRATTAAAGTAADCCRRYGGPTEDLLGTDKQHLFR